MQFGVHLPHIGVDPTASNVARMAQTSDALGYESVWVGDHVALPLRIESAYPYAPDHAMPVGRSMGWLDPIQTLTFAAAHTEKAWLGVSVLVLGMRQPVWNAKQLITLDVLSRGVPSAAPTMRPASPRSMTASALRRAVAARPGGPAHPVVDGRGRPVGAQRTRNSTAQQTRSSPKPSIGRERCLTARWSCSMGSVRTQGTDDAQ